LHEQGSALSKSRENGERLKNKQPGAVWHRVASLGFELPGLDSNQDKENQNPHTPRRKTKPHKAVAPSADSGCSAGCSDERREAGTPDADLAALIAAWPTLPDPIRAAIRTLVAAATVVTDERATRDRQND